MLPQSCAPARQRRTASPGSWPRKGAVRSRRLALRPRLAAAAQAPHQLALTMSMGWMITVEIMPEAPPFTKGLAAAHTGFSGFFCSAMAPAACCRCVCSWEPVCGGTGRLGALI